METFVTMPASGLKKVVYCQECAEKSFPLAPVCGTCETCGRQTSDKSHHRCPQCATKHSECQACGRPLESTIRETDGLPNTLNELFEAAAAQRAEVQNLVSQGKEAEAKLALDRAHSIAKKATQVANGVIAGKIQALGSNVGKAMPSIGVALFHSVDPIIRDAKSTLDLLSEVLAHTRGAVEAFHAKNHTAQRGRQRRARSRR